MLVLEFEFHSGRALPINTYIIHTLSHFLILYKNGFIDSPTSQTPPFPSFVSIPLSLSWTQPYISLPPICQWLKNLITKNVIKKAYMRNKILSLSVNYVIGRGNKILSLWELLLYSIFENHHYICYMFW